MNGQIKSVDVVVVGAGPAGAVTAYVLARRGANVMILEKEKLPREKVCGGGVQARTLHELPFSIQEVVENVSTGMIFSRQLRHAFARRASSPLVYQVRRERFDFLLTQKAVEAGANLRDGFPVASADIQYEGCRVRAATGEVINSKFVVFADGVTSLGFRLLNVQESRFIQLGMECDVPLVSSTGRYDPSLVSVDWGTMPDGYAWVFPKNDHLVVGCGGPRNQTQSLKAYLEAFTRRLGYSESQCVNIRAHPIPSLTKSTILANNRSVLVGDAGGFVEPFSGEGISYAIKSGTCAAEAISVVLNGTEDLPAAYTSRVEKSLTKEILSLRKMKEYFALVPSHIHRLFKKNDRVWAEFCKALYGEAPATVVRDNAPFAPFWPLFDYVSGVIYQHSLKRKVKYETEYFDRILARASSDQYPGMLDPGLDATNGAPLPPERHSINIPTAVR